MWEFFVFCLVIVGFVEEKEWGCAVLLMIPFWIIGSSYGWALAGFLISKFLLKKLIDFID